MRSNRSLLLAVLVLTVLVDGVHCHHQAKLDSDGPRLRARGCGSNKTKDSPTVSQAKPAPAPAGTQATSSTSSAVSQPAGTGTAPARPAAPGPAGTQTGVAKATLSATEASVADKLDRYLLNAAHPVGGAKAKWFQEALGFTRANAGDLAKQIVFDPSKAVQTAVTQHGTKFNQVISITGANGRVIDVTFAWIRNNDGVVRLITGIPAKP